MRIVVVSPNLSATTEALPPKTLIVSGNELVTRAKRRYLIDPRMEGNAYVVVDDNDFPIRVFDNVEDASTLVNKEDPITTLLARIGVAEGPVHVFFGASHCPPCRRFTPTLMELTTSHPCNVVWVCRDRTKEAGEAYHAEHGLPSTWNVIWPGDELGDDLVHRLMPFHVRTIPRLVVIDASTQSIINPIARDITTANKTLASTTPTFPITKRETINSWRRHPTFFVTGSDETREKAFSMWNAPPWYILREERDVPHDDHAEIEVDVGKVLVHRFAPLPTGGVECTTFHADPTHVWKHAIGIF